MPRKKNGYGNFSANGIKGVSKSIKTGKGVGSFGVYPSNRQFGTTVQRTNIEQYDLDSTWARWRRGMEYYFQGAYLDFADTDAILYQGTDFEVPVTFDGYRFATKNADSRTHYTIRRTVKENKQLGYITEIQANKDLYPTNYANREIWTKVLATRDLYSDDLLIRSVGERVTDGRTTASISWILTSDQKPATYLGKSPDKGNTVSVTIPLDLVRETKFIKDNNGDLQTLVGEAVYMPDFVVDRPIGLFDRFIEFRDFWQVDITEFLGGTRVEILDNTQTLPPTLGDVGQLDPIFKTDNSSGRLNGGFFFRKDIYQRFFGNQYLTADVVREQVDRLCFAIQPWKIQSIAIDEGSNGLTLTSEPFQASLKLFTPREMERYVVFSDNSFTDEQPDYNTDGVYLHALGKPGDKEWKKLNTSIDPWMDEIWSAGNALTIADLYTCSCPDYLHAIIRAPEIYDEQGRKLNRQQRYPMPTSKGTNDYDLAGIGRAAGIAESWASRDYRKGFKFCKHTVAAMFINKLRVEEPNTFPSVDARKAFEEKIYADINEVAEEFNAQLKRSEITTVEIVYALAEALNLDDIELGYVLLTSNF